MLSQFENLEHAVESDSELQNSIFEMTKQAAHDIRSPVTALNALVYSLPEISEDKKQFIMDISARINSIANDLLEKTKHLKQSASKQKTPKKKIATKQISLDEANPDFIIKKVVEEKKLEFQSHENIRFVHKASLRNVSCNINEMELARALSNLINNSFEALKGKGQIEIQSRINSGNFEICIQDNGQGIPAPILEKIGQEPITFGKENGFGIGVYYARRAVEAMGGKLLIKSKWGSGTLVVISLPVSEKAA